MNEECKHCWLFRNADEPYFECAYCHIKKPYVREDLADIEIEMAQEKEL